MPDDTATGGQASQAGALVVPPDIQEKFGELVALVRGSESMNDEERQYWINILPIMTPEQIQNLKDILTNERDQLAAIDAKYQTEVDRIGQAETVKKTEEERRKKREERSTNEASHKEEEDKATEALLDQIDQAGGK